MTIKNLSIIIIDAYVRNIKYIKDFILVDNIVQPKNSFTK